MTFVNEYASDTDIGKYDLKGVWDKYHPSKKGRYYLGHRPTWTIDKERNAFLMVLGQGREEYSNRTTFLLWWDGNHVIIELDLTKESSANLDETPFFVVWELVSISSPSELKHPENEVIALLKDALTEFGLRGVVVSVPNAVVKFKF